MTSTMDGTKSNQFRQLRDLTMNGALISGQSQNRPSLCTSETATKRAAILLACYRKGDAEDPQIYSAAVASVLSTYPEAIACKVTDPRTGIAGRNQWLPTVAEVRGACDAEMDPILAEQARAARRSESAQYLASPEAGRVSAARWKDLIAEIGPPKERETISPKSEEWLRTYGAKPLTLSPELRVQLASVPGVTEADEAYV